ncbi:hypothetical protein [Nostoc sp.]|uniref:hypothetical protein n=1 Tax=Nostoc sp. TaxID=1180 RepID=UPI002FFBEB76
MPSATLSGNAMKFTEDKILNLPDMKVLDFPEIEGEEIIITIEKNLKNNFARYLKPLNLGEIA